MFSSLIVSQIFMLIMSVLYLFDDELGIIDFLKIWAYFTPGIIMMLIIIGGWVMLVFSKFSRLSSTIFKALGFKNPDSVDLPKRLKIYLKNSSVSDQEREEYHFYSGWVYRY